MAFIMINHCQTVNKNGENMLGANYSKSFFYLESGGLIWWRAKSLFGEQTPHLEGVLVELVGCTWRQEPYRRGNNKYQNHERKKPCCLFVFYMTALSQLGVNVMIVNVCI